MKQAGSYPWQRTAGRRRKTHTEYSAAPGAISTECTSAAPVSSPFSTERPASASSRAKFVRGHKEALFEKTLDFYQKADLFVGGWLHRVNFSSLSRCRTFVHADIKPVGLQPGDEQSANVGHHRPKAVLFNRVEFEDAGHVFAWHYESVTFGDREPANASACSVPIQIRSAAREQNGQSTNNVKLL